MTNQSDDEKPIPLNIELDPDLWKLLQERAKEQNTTPESLAWGFIDRALTGGF